MFINFVQNFRNKNVCNAKINITVYCTLRLNSNSIPKCLKVWYLWRLEVADGLVPLPGSRLQSGVWAGSSLAYISCPVDSADKPWCSCCCPSWKALTWKMGWPMLSLMNSVIGMAILTSLFHVPRLLRRGRREWLHHELRLREFHWALVLWRL